MRVEVTKGSDVVASFAPGRGPLYHGEAGQRVRTLIEDPRYGYGLGLDGTVPGDGDAGIGWSPLPILSAALAVHGLGVRRLDLPAPVPIGGDGAADERHRRLAG